jgi:hypothetical protein
MLPCSINIFLFEETQAMKMRMYISAVQHPNENVIYLESAQYNVRVLEVFLAIVANISKFPLKQTNITSDTIQQDARKHKKEHQQKCKTGNTKYSSN